MHRSLPLPYSVKASFACHREAVQWKQFLISTAEQSYLLPLIQEKDTELQTVSIPDILFPAPKLPFPILKKWKPRYLNQQGPCIPASQEFATGQFTKSHHQTSLSFSLWRKQLRLLLELWQTSPNTALHKTHASWLLLDMIPNEGEGASALSDYHSITSSFTPYPQEKLGSLQVV